MKYITVIFLMLCSFQITAQSNAKDYIDRYKSVALQQMIETDIPASILLAQGIFESSVGSSVLATQANNHFTMSCINNWKGEVLYKLKDGSPKCFKVYNSPAESYIDHAQSLANNPQFENLFYIESTNYKRWAKGLEALNYKNYPNYADQLIQTIELYELYNIDKKIEKIKSEVVVETAENETMYLGKNQIYYNNDVKAVIAGEDETPLELAARIKMPLRKVLKYNDITLSDGFYPGQYVYLGRKKSKFSGEKGVHQVSQTDNIYLIAQQYGIRLNKLLKLNQLKKGEEPDINQKIYLKEKNPQKPFLRSGTFTPDIIPMIEKEEVEIPITITKPPTSVPKNNINTPPNEAETTYVYPSSGYDKTEEAFESGSSGIPEKGSITEIKPVDTEYSITNGTQIPKKPKLVPSNVHVVQKGETLYGISKQHNITVQRLKDLNGILENTIEIDQWLRFK
jgi:LysM repeat protein